MRPKTDPTARALRLEILLLLLLIVLIIVILVLLLLLVVVLLIVVIVLVVLGLLLVLRDLNLLHGGVRVHAQLRGHHPVDAGDQGRGVVDLVPGLYHRGLEE